MSQISANVFFFYSNGPKIGLIFFMQKKKNIDFGVKYKIDLIWNFALTVHIHVCGCE